VRRVLGGWQRTWEFPRDNDTRGRIEVHLDENTVSVQPIEFTGPAGNVRFGTALADDEKRWLVAEINAFLEKGASRIDRAD